VQNLRFKVGVRHFIHIRHGTDLLAYCVLPS
jgi:hypothetical protein